MAAIYVKLEWECGLTEVTKEELTEQYLDGSFTGKWAVDRPAAPEGWIMDMCPNCWAEFQALQARRRG